MGDAIIPSWQQSYMPANAFSRKLTVLCYVYCLTVMYAFFVVILSRLVATIVLAGIHLWQQST